MHRVDVFAFRVSQAERQAIADLALRLQRSQSDAVGFVVTEVAKQLIVLKQAAGIHQPLQSTILNRASGDDEKV